MLISLLVLYLPYLLRSPLYYCDCSSVICFSHIVTNSSLFLNRHWDISNLYALACWWLSLTSLNVRTFYGSSSSWGTLMVYHHQRQQNRWCMLTWRAHNTLPPTTPRDHDFPTPYRHHQRCMESPEKLSSSRSEWSPPAASTSSRGSEHWMSLHVSKNIFTRSFS